MSLAPLVKPIYVPTLINQVSEQLTATSIALFALEITGSRAFAGIAVGAAGIGETVANVPASLVYRALGAQHTLAAGQLLSGVASLLVALACRARARGLFTAALALIGVGDAIFRVGRSAHVREVTAPAIRGRATAMMGGIGRVAQVLGPPIGGVVVARAGIASAFALRAAGKAHNAICRQLLASCGLFLIYSL